MRAALPEPTRFHGYRPVYPLCVKVTGVATIRVLLRNRPYPLTISKPASPGRSRVPRRPSRPPFIRLSGKQAAKRHPPVPMGSGRGCTQHPRPRLFSKPHIIDCEQKSGTPWGPAFVYCVCWPCSAGGSSQAVRVSCPCEGGGDVVEPFNGLVDGGDGLLTLSS